VPILVITCENDEGPHMWRGPTDASEEPECDAGIDRAH